MEIALDGDASSTGQQFLPKDQLCQVINTTTVCAELANCLPSSCETGQIEKYAETICSITPCYVNGRVRQRSYRSIFAILVLAERSSFILSFIEEQVSDLDLPLVPVKECRNLIGMRRRSSGPNQSPQPLLDSFNDEDWSPSSREQFDRYQWYMLAPFFSKGRHGQINHYPLHDHHILPFVTWNQAEDDNAESQGGYGRVIMVKLHPAHHKLKRKTYNDRGFAVKQLLQNDRKSFRKEREMLKKFSGANSHPHIVSLLATYRHRNKYHFIFDRAQGDLGKLWGKYETLPDLSHNDIVWIADQCLGITKGLFMIHRHRTFRKRCISETEDQADDRDRQGRVTFSKTLAPAASDGMAPKNDSKFVTSNTTTNRTFSIENDDPEHYEIRYGRHGDLNPQNILWFTEESEEPGEMACILRGTLRIADFGTAEMNSLWSKSGIRDVANTMTYRPPECDSADRTIRQSFDIWCLGCVFLEFVTWTLGGAHLVRKFAMKRAQCDPYTNVDSDTYFELVWNESTHKTEARIKPAVFEVCTISRMM
jgi:serine/threonine protein kinase